MATTLEGRALTDAHRRAQVAIGANAQIVARALWGRLDPARLDESAPAWIAANVSAARLYHEQSRKAAGAYLSQYRRAELGSPDGPVVLPEFDEYATATDLRYAGPVSIKLLVKGGMDGQSAHRTLSTKAAGLLGRASMMGGRQAIDLSAAADTQAIGWRRVSDGDPCTFCAMLCSRGPVYRSGASAGTDEGALLDNKSGMRFHSHCGCTAEIVYGSWQPTPREQGYINEYQRAAAAANEAGFSRTESSVLPRMRSAGTFRDSGARRNK